MISNTLTRGCAAALSSIVVLLAVAPTARAGDDPKKFRGLLGKNNKRVMIEDGKTLLWAGGAFDKSSESQWYDFTGSPIPVEQLQFGIGKDAIPSIDDPMFVKPNDPRLKRIGKSHYRSDEKIGGLDDIRVIGYVVDGEAKAYPTALLDRHELVNDTIAGKPVTVGW